MLAAGCLHMACAGPVAWRWRAGREVGEVLFHYCAAHLGCTKASHLFSIRGRCIAAMAGQRHNPAMAQGKRISVDISEDALGSIKALGAAAKAARLASGEGQAAAASRLGVHVQTIGRIEAGEPGVAIGHVVGMLALYGAGVECIRKTAE